MFYQSLAYIEDLYRIFYIVMENRKFRKTVMI